MRRTAPSPAELRIAAGLRRRDPDAVRTLCHDYGPSALAFLHMTLRDRATAEDVYQQVMLEAWQRSATYDPRRSSLRTWLGTIARSRAIDELRRRIPEPDPDVARHAPTVAADDPVDRIVLSDLLDALPPAERAVVRLQYQLGLSQSQIATQTGIPLGTVKSRTAAALRHLRAALADS